MLLVWLRLGSPRDPRGSFGLFCFLERASLPTAPPFSEVRSDLQISVVKRRACAPTESRVCSRSTRFGRRGACLDTEAGPARRMDERAVRDSAPKTGSDETAARRAK